MRDQVEIGVFGSHWHYLIRESIPKRLEGILGLELVPEVVDERVVYLGVDKGQQFALLPWHPFDLGSLSMEETKHSLESQLGALVCEFCPNAFTSSPVACAQDLQQTLKSYLIE